MVVKHSTNDICIHNSYNWYIQWYDDDNYKFAWGTDVAYMAGFDKFYDMLNKLKEIFGCSIYNGNIFFKTKETAVEAVEWLESKIIVNELSKIS